MKNKVYVLTSEINEYDQMGKYFVAWFANKPSVDDLLNIGFNNIDLINHILNGGGRQKVEDTWYYLSEIEEKTNCWVDLF